MFLSQENSLHKILTQTSALCSQLGEEGPQCLQNWTQTAWEGGLLTGPRFCWMGSSTSEPQGQAALCSDGGITVSVENTDSPSLQPCPYSALATFMSRSGVQVPTEKQVGKWKLILDDPELSASAPSLMSSGHRSVLPGPGVLG